MLGAADAPRCVVLAVRGPRNAVRLGLRVKPPYEAVIWITSPFSHELNKKGLRRRALPKEVQEDPTLVQRVLDELQARADRLQTLRTAASILPG